MPGTVMRLKALDGTWETCGVDRVARVVPESVDVDSDDWGNKTAKFDLKRDPGLVWPDIGAYAPVVVEIDGQPSWAGRVIETPSRGRVMTVNCEGWQHHLDDDLVDLGWVHTRLADWKDARGFPDCLLGAGPSMLSAASTVSAGDGVIALTYPRAVYHNQWVQCAAILDLGPARTARRVLATITNSATHGEFRFQIRGGDSVAMCQGIVAGGETIDDVQNGISSGAAYTCSGTFTTARRYVMLLCTPNANVSYTDNDSWFKVTDCKVFAETTYEAGNTSVLKASAVVADAINKGTVQLAPDRSGIVDTAFNIPEFAPSGPQTPRELISAVNGWHNWIRKVDVNKRPIFAPLPSRPKYTAALGVELEDSSQNSGREIYNRVLVTGTDPSGQPVRIERSAGQSGSERRTRSGVPTIANPSFDTNTTGWSSTSSGGATLALSRDTSTFDTSPASLRASATIAGGGGAYLLWTISVTWSGTFSANKVYILDFWKSQANTQPVALSIGGQPISSFVPNGFNSLGWVPKTDLVNPVMTFSGYQPPRPYLQVFGMNLDSFAMSRAEDTLITRRGFLRTKQLQVGVTLPSDGVAAAAIGDLWLQQNSSTPFRGTVTLTGPKALRDRVSGQPVPLKQLLADTGELIHFPDRPDPDTGAVGRNGRIASVSYNPATDTATVAIDSNRADFEALMSRMQVTAGQVT